VTAGTVARQGNNDKFLVGHPLLAFGPEHPATVAACKHSAFMPTFGTTRAVTRALRRGDGEFARSVKELRRTRPQSIRN